MLLGSLLSEYGTMQYVHRNKMYVCHYTTLQKKDLLCLKFPQKKYRISL
jgi:hypothetical protein